MYLASHYDSSELKPLMEIKLVYLASLITPELLISGHRPTTSVERLLKLGKSGSA